MVRKKKEFRELKVSSFSGYGYKTAPMLRLQGLWLEQCGFNIGDPILVKCEDGKLTITLNEERAFIEEKKQAFLDAEMQKFEKKYEAEPLLEYAPGCNATVAYTELGRELIANEG